MHPAASHGFLQTEHTDLMRQIKEIRTWWRGRKDLNRPNYGEMSRRVMDLRHCLSRHMDREEGEGLLTSCAAVNPNVDGTVHDLLAEHQQFRQMLANLADKLARGQVAYHDWSEPYAELEQILTMLEDHEAVENSLFQATYGGSWPTK